VIASHRACQSCFTTSNWIPLAPRLQQVRYQCSPDRQTPTRLSARPLPEPPWLIPQFGLRNKSASSGELACPHLSDHPTQKATQRTTPNHGRSVPIFLVPLRDLFGHSGSGLRGDKKTPVIPQIPDFRSNPSAPSADRHVRRLSPFHRILNVTVSLCHKVATAKNSRNTRKNTRRNTSKLPKNTQNPQKNTFFFYEPRNVNSCSAYPVKKIRNTSQPFPRIFRDHVLQSEQLLLGT
jgi:hypothetical protein